jgi:hypothetical protein
VGLTFIQATIVSPDGGAASKCSEAVRARTSRGS